MTGGAFVQAFRQEMETASHEVLVETFCWVNRQGYGYDPTLRERGEAWARRVEEAGKKWDVLMALTQEEEE